MKRIIGIVAIAGSLFTQPIIASAQTTDSPDYFIPPPAPPAAPVSSGQSGNQGGAVVSAHPVGSASPIIDTTLIDTVPPPNMLAYNTPIPWYETDWGVAGIGVAATGFAMLFDYGINNFTQNRLSANFRNHVALRGADAIELAPLVFAGVTMIQSPISDPRLANASSIAMTSAAAVTVISMGLKYAIGRDRPSGPDSDPFVAQPFDAAHSSFSIGAVFPGFSNPTSSFPSGHTALTFALVTPYAEIYHAPALYAIPVTVGLLRIAAQDGHWASDVVGGGFIGWLTADITRRYFPNSDYGLMIFGDGQQMSVGLHGQF